jgi:hypothetical protein
MGDVWFKLWLIDDGFKKYGNIRIFISNKTTHYRHKNEVHITYLFGKEHSIYDEPSRVENGFREWHYNGILHRTDDKPAMIYSNGLMVWYKNGMIHRDGDKPAVIGKDKLWYKNGMIHRDNDKPARITTYRHQLYSNGALHRMGGPAIVYDDGSTDYYINGKWYTSKHYLKICLGLAKK